jgi:hypothetical protein
MIMHRRTSHDIAIERLKQQPQKKKASQLTYSSFEKTYIGSNRIT